MEHEQSEDEGRPTSSILSGSVAVGSSSLGASSETASVSLTASSSLGVTAPSFFLCLGATRATNRADSRRAILAAEGWGAWYQYHS
jgi:hypothetical protein